MLVRCYLIIKYTQGADLWCKCLIVSDLCFVEMIQKQHQKIQKTISRLAKSEVK
ncbi:hypothetical protein M23134_05326 [Microscilla marina ATCC 23134]|uniref:Uncharacterized protein n=1 Tax=Microscilla marina ATCC 23134 TaxID=313606 RepID=A1ZHI6_MICM2|nr:hypothetical protein M23134_05326 [Microscilla marina ATCC 23134]